MVAALGARTFGGGQNLLVGQNGSKGGAIPNGSLRHVGQPFLIKLQEDPLGPAEILRIGGVDLPGPVVTESHGLNLPPEIIDILLGGEARVGAGLDGVLFGGKAEGIPTHRMEHIMPSHPPISGHDVGGGVALQMSDMETGSGGIRKHIEDVTLGFFRARFAGLGGTKAGGFDPAFLPTGLDFGEGIGRAGWHMQEEAILNAKPHAKSNLPSSADFMDCHPQSREKP